MNLRQKLDDNFIATINFNFWINISIILCKESLEIEFYLVTIDTYVYIVWHACVYSFEQVV